GAHLRHAIAVRGDLDLGGGEGEALAGHRPLAREEELLGLHRPELGAGVDDVRAAVRVGVHALEKLELVGERHAVRWASHFAFVATAGLRTRGLRVIEDRLAGAGARELMRAGEGFAQAGLARVAGARIAQAATVDDG